MLRNILVLLVLVAFSGKSANCQNSEKIDYDLSKPDQVLHLPNQLLEISGLTALDPETFACVQDEKGIVYIYDALKNEIKTEFNFHIDGDYEGITEVRGTIYILRSDGTLFEISDYQDPGFTVHSYKTGIPANNNEGLCFDEINDRLLLASKSKPITEPKETPLRVIYGFDLKTKRLSDKPAYEFNVNELEAYAKKLQIDLPVKTKKDGTISEPSLKLKTSAIALHPISHELYLLSAKDHFLFIFNHDGSLIHMMPLNEKMYNKAEGITFYHNGDMLITNEGEKDGTKEATALKFKYKKK